MQQGNKRETEGGKRGRDKEEETEEGLGEDKWIYCQSASGVELYLHHNASHLTENRTENFT